MRLCKAIGMSRSNSCPHHIGVGSGKRAYASDREEKRRDLDLLECLESPCLVAGLDITEEAEGELHLLRGK